MYFGNQNDIRVAETARSFRRHHRHGCGLFLLRSKLTKPALDGLVRVIAQLPASWIEVDHVSLGEDGEMPVMQREEQPVSIDVLSGVLPGIRDGLYQLTDLVYPVGGGRAAIDDVPPEGI